MDYSSIAIIGSFVGMLVGLWSIAKSFKEDLDKTTSLLFKRFDAHKDATDMKIIHYQEAHDIRFAKAGECEITRQNFSKLFDEINKKLDLLLEERRNGKSN